ncbi:hypothetical protein BWI96_11965 [Siphonobacter sp. SORGH_AS_0500]|uniref:hypothetical protein n=1 Tax=Siphonobacter sp. SORGH_AS_0500 TaxID=1864824 RepID=UPI000CADB852|nr:hypothetical protein [Siphonobacter sp. SORGH_AS_0500]PKK36561.1 hypothetical protein BWI96_11965 [Siphonobacter sp. SORGH_AS_0500]
MKKDRIERFIRDNREDFDSFEPPLGLWAEIERRLPEVIIPAEEETKIIPLGKQKSIWSKAFTGKNWGIAAGIIFLLGLGFSRVTMRSNLAILTQLLQKLVQKKVKWPFVMLL